MRVFFDFEFIEGGSAFVMEPISLGMIREDGNEYYREFKDVDWSKANPWVLENVKPHLLNLGIRTKGQVAEEVRDFVGERPEFWAYFADYDWVLLCQLFGTMIDLPKGWPYYCLDIKQLMYHTGTDREELDQHVEKPNPEHSALADAKWNMRAFNWILQSKGIR